MRTIDLLFERRNLLHDLSDPFTLGYTILSSASYCFKVMQKRVLETFRESSKIKFEYIKSQNKEFVEIQL